MTKTAGETREWAFTVKEIMFGNEATYTAEVDADANLVAMVNGEGRAHAIFAKQGRTASEQHNADIQAAMIELVQEHDVDPYSLTMEDVEAYVASGTVPVYNGPDGDDEDDSVDNLVSMFGKADSDDDES